MQANWSLVLNVLLLAGVVVAIARVIKERRKNQTPAAVAPSVGKVETSSFDDIISVRKVNHDENAPSLTAQRDQQPIIQSAVQPTPVIRKPVVNVEPMDDVVENKSIMLFLLAKDNRQLAGYELLQTLLAAGLRFGDGHLFHRHQHLNGQGPVLCSLAAATPTGTFDLQNIGAFSVHGLCLFMQASGNASIDAERYDIMLETAKQLSEDLDTHLLDDQRKPFTNASLLRNRRSLGIDEHCEQPELA